ncbi:MAG: hypothetical protein ABEJ69_03095 [Candidatus Nanohaloarchaea archaeon]
MVYEVKCAECGKIMDFGGREPSDFSGEEKLPEDAIEFQGEVYCRECVKKFVQFGVGEVEDRVDWLEDQLKEVLDAMGMEENLDPEQ